MSISRGCLLALLFVSCITPALAQECPQEREKGPSVPSEDRTLEGRLVFHDGLRKWFELKLDQPQCGQPSIELVPGGRELQVLRGCRVRSKGVIDFSPTGYYSLDTYQSVDQIEAVGACERQLPFADYSKAKPAESVRYYRVDMHIDSHGDHPIAFRVSSGGRELQPWQAYASYLLTGGFVLYGSCAKGFVVDKVFGAPEAAPAHFDEPRTPNDMAMFDPEDAIDSNNKGLHLGYTCVRAW